MEGTQDTGKDTANTVTRNQIHLAGQSNNIPSIVCLLGFKSASTTEVILRS